MRFLSLLFLAWSWKSFHVLLAVQGFHFPLIIIIAYSESHFDLCLFEMSLNFSCNSSGLLPIASQVLFCIYFWIYSLFWFSILIVCLPDQTLADTSLLFNFLSLTCISDTNNSWPVSWPAFENGWLNYMFPYSIFY